MDPESASVEIDGVPLPIRPDLVYYLVYKPTGVVSTAADPEGRPIVTDIVPQDPRVFPVGRLDVDSEGLILLTNDGALTNLITHPRHGVDKTYLARVEGRPDKAVLRRLTAGIELDDGPATALKARTVASHEDESLVEIVMGEGRKREVRRMLKAVGHPVQRLVRTAIGPLSDQRLEPGTCRVLSIGEIRSLYSAAGSTWEDASHPTDGPD